MRSRLVWTRLLAVVALWGGAPEFLLAQPPPENVAVEGVVRSRETQAPVAGAVAVLLPAVDESGNALPAGQVQYSGSNQVWARNAQIVIQGVPPNWTMGGDATGRATTPVTPRQPGAVATDAKGHFTFEKVEEGDYTLDLLAPGFMRDPPERLRVRATSPPRLDLALSPFKFVRGRVLQADGTPLANALLQIYLQPRNPAPYTGSVGPEPTPTTNAQGEFRVLFRQPGEHTLTVVAPNVGAAGPQTVVTQADEDFTGVELQLRPCGFVAGQVRRKRTGQPVSGVYLNLSGGPPGPSLNATTDDQGEFAIPNVPPGDYTVYCQPTGFVQPPSDPARVVRVGEGQRVDNVVVELTPYPKITGRILRPDGTPLANQNNVQIGLAVQTPQGQTTTSMPVNTDANGTFSVSQQFYLPGFGPALASLAVADVGCGRQRLRLVEGEDPPPLEIRLQPFGSVAGVLRERETKQPLVGASIGLSSRWSSVGSVPAARTDEQGRFALTNVPAGVYSLYANMQGYSYPAGREVSVQAGERVEDVLLEMTRAPSLAGQVSGPDGKTPLAGAVVRLGNEERTTDAQGAFTFENAGYGNVLVVQAAGLAPVVKPLVRDVTQPDPREEVQIVLRYAGGRLSGTVRRTDTGQPLAEAVVAAWDRSTQAGYSSPFHLLRNLESNPEAWNPQNQWPWQELRKFVWTRTDVEGRYQLDHLAEGEYAVYAVAPGRRVIRRESVAVPEGADVRGVDLALPEVRSQETPGPQVSGRLSKADGAPLALTDFQWSLLRGARPTASSSAKTDAEGGYVISLQGWFPSWRIAGPYTLQVFVRGFQPARREGLILPDDPPVENMDFPLEEQRVGSISGTVFLPDGQTPAEGVRVTVPSGQRPPNWPYRDNFARTVQMADRSGDFGYAEGGVLTDEQGHYHLEGLEPATYTVVALLPRPEEYLGVPSEALRNTAPAARENVAVAEGQETAGVNLTLAAAGAISGVVVDADGEPRPGVSVSASLPPDAPAKWLAPVSGSHAYTDEKGQFRLKGVPPGTWNLSAYLAGFVTKQERGVVVQAGGETGGLTLRLRKQQIRWATLSGRVLLPDGNLAEQARVFVQGTGWYGIPADLTGPDGRFALPRVYPGWLRLMAWKVGYAWSRPVEVPVRAQEKKEDVTLTLQVGGTVEGQVLPGEGDSPARSLATSAAETFVWAVPATERLWSLLPDSSLLVPRRLAMVDEEGRFTLTHLSPGENHIVLADANGVVGGVVRSVVVQPGEKVDGLSLRWEPPRGIIMGTVNQRGDPQRVAGAQVSAYNDLFGRYQFHSQTDEEGQFTLYDLPPDTYHVFCDAPGWANFARRNIAVNGEEPAQVDFELSVGGTLAGKVVGTDGQTPVEGATVTTLSADQAAFDPSPAGLSYRTATTDEDGAFALPNLRPGPYEILIAGPESVEWTRRPVEVKEGETATVEVRLEE